MTAVIMDTDVASHVFKGEMPASLKAHLDDDSPMISFVTYTEMIKWTEKHSWTPRQCGRLDHYLEQRAVAECDELVWRACGRISARAELRRRPRPANDTWIAACCISHGIPLATRNVKDFADFAEHEGLELIEA